MAIAESQSKLFGYGLLRNGECVMRNYDICVNASTGLDSLSANKPNNIMAQTGSESQAADDESLVKLTSLSNSIAYLSDDDFPWIDFDLDGIAIFYIGYLISNDFDQRRVLKMRFLRLGVRIIDPTFIFLPGKSDHATRK